MRVGVVFPQTEIGADPVGIPSPISGTIASVPPKAPPNTSAKIRDEKECQGRGLWRRQSN